MTAHAAQRTAQLELICRELIAIGPQCPGFGPRWTPTPRTACMHLLPQTSILVTEYVCLTAKWGCSSMIQRRPRKSDEYATPIWGPNWDRPRLNIVHPMWGWRKYPAAVTCERSGRDGGPFSTSFARQSEIESDFRNALIQEKYVLHP